MRSAEIYPGLKVPFRAYKLVVDYNGEQIFELDDGKTGPVGSHVVKGTGKRWTKYDLDVTIHTSHDDIESANNNPSFNDLILMVDETPCDKEGNSTGETRRRKFGFGEGSHRNLTGAVRTKGLHLSHDNGQFNRGNVAYELT